jgi:hypothetical protein
MKISVWNCRAQVARRVDLGPNEWTYESAANWEELELDAILAVEDLGGAVNISGLYPCPVGLAERARFDNDESQDTTLAQQDKRGAPGSQDEL